MLFILVTRLAKIVHTLWWSYTHTLASSLPQVCGGERLVTVVLDADCV